jgi:hypothetical protein
MLSSTAILADGINLGLTRMVEACRRATLRQLAWTHDWHVREDCYAAALAQLIEAHRSLPLARVGAMGLPPVPMDNFTVRAIAAKLWATSMPDTATSPATRSIPTSPTSLGSSTPKSLQPPHLKHRMLLLDYYNITGLRIAEHYIDTGGATDHVFGLLTLLGFRFAPRLRDLEDRRLYAFRGQKVPDVLTNMLAEQSMPFTCVPTGMMP